MKYTILVLIILFLLNSALFVEGLQTFGSIFDKLFGREIITINDAFCNKDSSNCPVINNDRVLCENKEYNCIVTQSGGRCYLTCSRPYGIAPDCLKPSADEGKFYCNLGYVYKCVNKDWSSIFQCGETGMTGDCKYGNKQVESASSGRDMCEVGEEQDNPCSNPTANDDNFKCVGGNVYQCDDGYWNFYKACSDYGNYECAFSSGYVTSDIGSLCKPRSGCTNPLAIEGQFYCNLGYVYKCVNKDWSSIFQCGETGMTGDCKYGNKQVESASSGRDMCEVGEEQDNPCKNPPANDDNFKCVGGNVYQCDDGYWNFYKACSDYGSYNCTFSQDYVSSYIGELCKKISGCSGPTANEGQYYCQNSNVLRCQTGVWNSVKQCQGICYNSVQDISEEVCYEATKKDFCVWEEKITPVLSEPVPGETFKDGTVLSSMDGEHLFGCYAGEWKEFCEHDGSQYSPDSFYIEGTSVFICIDGKWNKSNDCVHHAYYRIEEGVILEEEDPLGSDQWYTFKCEKGEWIKLQKTQPAKCEFYSGPGQPQLRFNILFVNKMSKGTKEDFKNAVGIITNYLFDIPPFGGYKQNFNIYLVYDPHSTKKIITDCGIPNYYIVMLDDSSEVYGSFAAGNQVYLYTSTENSPIPEEMQQYITKQNVIGMVFTHEFGHAFGDLDDEYIYFEERTFVREGGNCDNTVTPIESEIPICNFWPTSLGECIQGCTNKNFYRSSFDSIMRGGEPRETNLKFNKVSQKILRDKLSNGIQTQSIMAAFSQEPPYSIIITLILTKDKLNISDITLKKGWPDQKESKGRHTLRLLSDSNSILYETRFDLSLEINSYPPPQIFDDKGNQIDFPRAKTLGIATKTLIIPYFEKATGISILKDGALVASAKIPFGKAGPIKPKTGWIVSIFIIIVLAYLFWEKGPKSGFFKK